ncbi:MAG: hypothetical protein Q8R30_04115 [bacterium]|nr:hypothetical protein [bacterium]
MDHFLSRIKKSSIIPDPFPHIILENAVDDTLYRELANSLPDWSLFTDKEYRSNVRLSVSPKKMLENNHIPDVWKEFTKVNCKQETLERFIWAFEDDLKRYYPDGWWRNLKAGILNIDTYENHDILMDTGLAFNTPVYKPSKSVVTAHVDLPNKFPVGLWYMRKDEDDSQGGDLELYRFRGRPLFHSHHFASPEVIEKVKTIPYKKNLLALFFNSLHSLHGVTERSVTSHARNFVALIGQVADTKPLFDIRAHQEHPFFNRLRYEHPRLYKISRTYIH